MGREGAALMGAGGSGAQRPASGKAGRPVGTPNRDKIELRALIQEKVLEWTSMRRQIDEQAGLPPDQCQEIIEEYDPVIHLATIAMDRRSTLDQRIRCSAEVSQYVRPKLKSVEVNMDPEALETIEERRVLSEKLVGLLEAASAATKPERSRPATPPSSEDDPQ